MTLSELSYNILNSLTGGRTSDDEKLQLEQIKFWINSERVFLLLKDFLTFNTIYEDVVQDLGCLELHCADEIECCEIGFSSGTVIWKTKEIPEPIIELITFVGTVNKRPIDMIKYHHAINIKNLKYTGDKTRVFYMNKKLYVINPKGLKYITARGIFKNPEEVKEYTTCDGSYCYTEESNYPIAAHMIPELTQNILQKYTSYYASMRPYDNNDGKDNQKEGE